MAKSASFGVLHLGIAFSIGYLLTGSVAIAGAITLIEPVANTIAHYFFDRWRTAREARKAAVVTGHTGAKALPGGPALQGLPS